MHIIYEETWVLDLSGVGVSPSGYSFLGDWSLRTSHPPLQWTSISSGITAVLITLNPKP